MPKRYIGVVEGLNAFCDAEMSSSNLSVTEIFEIADEIASESLKVLAEVDVAVKLHETKLLTSPEVNNQQISL